MTTLAAARSPLPASGVRALAGARISVDARYLERPGIGITIYLERAIEQLIEAGAELTLLAARPAAADALAARYGGAGALPLGARTAFGWEQSALARYLRAARPDVHIAGANFGLPLVPTGNTRLLLVLHDLIPLELPGLYLRARPAWAAQWLISTAISLQRASLVATPSAASAAAVRRLVRSKPLRLAYPPLPERQPALDASSARHSELPDRYLIYLGGYDPRKNVVPLLRCFAALRESGRASRLGLMLLGQPPHEVAALARGLAPDGMIRAVGFVPEHEKLALVRSALAVVHPSSTEGFGLPLAEAFACGVPVLSGTGGALREVGGDAPIYVDPSDDHSLLDGLSAVAAMPSDERADRVERGHRRLAQLRRESADRSLPAAVAALLDQTARPGEDRSPAHADPHM